ncbi:MAG: ribokinase [Candidatus Nephrothrix sp. EaCA]|nr:MAG: ribokinase [Candidatus Nephrothrix sp. EaCA]
MKKIVTVVGSSNTDLVVRTANFPKPGETIIGKEFKVFAGGKGANQAVACARLGGEVFFIARIGNDSFGKEMWNGFQKDAISTEYIFTDEQEPSGTAFIMLDSRGQNSIVVSPGANNQLSPENIKQSAAAIEKASIILTQLEIPLATVNCVLKTAADFGKKVILNPAPAAALDEDMYARIYLITPNETEAALLTGRKADNEKTAEEAANILLSRGVRNVIITLGEKGVYFKNQDKSFHLPALKTEVVDTTGAGDIFNGAIAVALAEGKDWESAILFANKASAISVSRMGAQPSAPYRNEITGG